MNITSLCYITLITLFIIYIILKFREKILNVRLLSKLPKSKRTTIFGNTDVVAIERDQLFRKFVEDSRTYYPLYTYRILNLYLVCIVSPEDVEAIISKTRNLSKASFYISVHMWLQMGLLTSTDEKWKARRKILTPTFHFNILQQFVPTFVEHSTKLCNQIDGLVGQTVDVVPILSKHSLHIICETAMGIKIEGQDSTKYTNAIHKMGKLAIQRTVRPWLFPQISFMLSPLYYKTLTTANYLHKYTSDIINKRQKNFDVNQISKLDNNVYKSTKNMAMLDMMLYAKLTGANIDDRGICEEVDTFLFEGHDTTSTCVCFTLMLLANHPEVQSKIVEELEEVLPTSRTTITYEILNNMSYLERVIKESLRLYPSVPVIGRKISKQMTTPSGHVLPKGAEIMLKIFEMHRHPKLYRNPDKFDPDRFLPENVKMRHPYSYIPFSAGPRNCIGQKFAMLEVKTIVASILRKFELVAVDTPDSLVLISDLVLRSKDGIRVQFRRRSKWI